MRRVTMGAIAVAVAAVLLVVACNGSTGGDAPADDTETMEVGVPCYTQDGAFVRWDDDCRDDKDSKGRPLVVGPPKSVKTSGGMKTAGPAKPSSRSSRR